MATARTEAYYREAYETFCDIWQQRNLPSDVRMSMMGAIQAAGRKQGDEIFDETIMDKCNSMEVPTEDELRRAFDAIHKFVIVDHRLRDQYLVIILKMMVKQLENEHSDLARNLSRQIKDIASMN